MFLASSTKYGQTRTGPEDYRWSVQLVSTAVDNNRVCLVIIQAVGRCRRLAKTAEAGAQPETSTSTESSELLTFLFLSKVKEVALKSGQEVYETVAVLKRYIHDEIVEPYQHWSQLE